MEAGGVVRLGVVWGRGADGGYCCGRARPSCGVTLVRLAQAKVVTYGRGIVSAGTWRGSVTCRMAL